MKITTTSGRDISKIGIGTFGVGGRGHRDVKITEKKDDSIYISSLIYSLNLGMNFTELCLGYGHGESIKLFKNALNTSNFSREDVFITHSLYLRDLQSIDTIHEDIGEFYNIMDTNYADSTLVTQSILIKFGENKIYEVLHKLLREGKTRFVSLSNASTTWIHKFYKEFGDSFYAHEGHLSFEVRALNDKNILETCHELDVRNIIWRPLRRNKTKNLNWALLLKLEEKYKKSQYQIILNWIIYKGYYPMVFSTNTKNIKENFESLNFEMTKDDYNKIDNFKVENYTPPEVDWESINIDNDIVNLIQDIDNKVNTQ